MNMFLFMLGLIVTLAGFIISFVLPSDVPNPLRWLLRLGAPIVGLCLITISTAIYVEDNQAGVVVIKFGSDLPTGQIIATNGEKGPQAAVLPPGWHFGYLPFWYELSAVDNITNGLGSGAEVDASAADRARGAVLALRAVGRGKAAEPMSLHYAREALALADPGHVDVPHTFKDLHVDGLTKLIRA